MSSPRLAIPVGPRQPRTQMEAGLEGQQKQQQEIADLAYALWQQRAHRKARLTRTGSRRKKFCRPAAALVFESLNRRHLAGLF